MKEKESRLLAMVRERWSDMGYLFLSGGCGDGGTKSLRLPP